MNEVYTLLYLGYLNLIHASHEIFFTFSTPIVLHSFIAVQYHTSYSEYFYTSLYLYTSLYILLL